jgi:hypothetical protein
VTCDTDLFQLALGLAPPWMVAAADFDAEEKPLDIEIDFKTGGPLADLRRSPSTRPRPEQHPLGVRRKRTVIVLGKTSHALSQKPRRG